MSRGLKAVLILSIFLNAVFFGFALKQILPFADRWQTAPLSLADMEDKLPEADRAAFKEALLPAMRDAMALRLSQNANRAALVKIIKADPFDKAAYLAQSEQAIKLSSDINESVTRTVLALGVAMSPAGRQVIADHLRDLSWTMHHPAGLP